MRLDAQLLHGAAGTNQIVIAEILGHQFPAALVHHGVHERLVRGRGGVDRRQSTDFAQVVESRQSVGASLSFGADEVHLGDTRDDYRVLARLSAGILVEEGLSGYAGEGDLLALVLVREDRQQVFGGIVDPLPLFS